MKKLEVFDPAVWCYPGVCGVESDPVLVQFSDDLHWLAQYDIRVNRYNLFQEPQAFADNPEVVREMQAGTDRLPIILVDGRIVFIGMYPSRAQLVQKLGIAPTSAEASPIAVVGGGG